MMGLRVDDIAPLDVGVAGESDPPIGLGVVVLTGLNLTVVYVIFVVLHLPIRVIVWDMGLFFTLKNRILALEEI